MTRTCNECGWVAFGVSRDQAEEEVKKFNEYFQTLNIQEQEDYYGGRAAAISFYEHCLFCHGLYTNFRDSKEGDCPDGVTLNPIIIEELKQPRKVPEEEISHDASM